MAIEHINIPDAQRHEPKGASTAADGQVIVSNGDGTTSWVNPYTLVTSNTTVVLESGSTNDQTPSAVDTPIQVEFGTSTSNSYVSLSGTGTITINTTGYYVLTFNFINGRTAGAGEAILLTRLLLNDNPSGFVSAVSLDDADIKVPYQANTEGYFSAGTTLKIQFQRDGGGINNGGLYALSPNDVTWDDVYSAFVRIRFVEGAS